MCVSAQMQLVKDGESRKILSLCSAGCNTLRQWDLTRAVPRLVRDVKLEKGDIMGIATRKGFVYTCGADGSIR